MVVRPRGGGDGWWSSVVWGEEGGGAMDERRGTVGVLGGLGPEVIVKAETESGGGAERGSPRETIWNRQSLIQKKKAVEQKEHHECLNVRVRASDMPLALQNRAFTCARDNIDSTPGKKLDSKRIALALKKRIKLVDIWLDSAVLVQRMGEKIKDRTRISTLMITSVQEFDSAYGPAWHCIVGTSFGSYVTHSTGGFLYFSIDKIYILLFKTAVQPLGH
ncbi:hypothetical protein RHSIM_Rhsim09G0092200 [Rhododendron simsii]|uniref:Dynein light chain n=1 Tax=Rhododendron simsii TaxID=118357 RepID=A0A834GL88_RHOSS|nr:hypothetical protein RHSIM_Rhsim09G0092200 [Rhododendron simsii]